jgi:hypothetical protein
MRLPTSLATILDSADRTDNVILVFNLVNEHLLLGLEVEVALAAVLMIGVSFFVKLHGCN